jgi:histidine ammonia-lyase
VGTPLLIDGFHLTVADLAAAAREDRPVKLSPEAVERVRAAQETLESLIAAGSPIYGVTTGFGALDARQVRPEHRALLQRNLLLSHAAGVGRPLPREVVRAMLVARANVLAQGFPAVRLATLEGVVEMLNRDVCPVVPEKGSLGASGDLQALAHLMLPLIGEGVAEVGGRRLPGSEALAAVGLNPVALDGRDGLALINGSEQASATAALVIVDAERLLRSAAIAAALATEALHGLDSAFEEWIHLAKPHPGQVRVAAHLRRLLRGSRIVAGAGRAKLRDPLSIRCVPQVLGTAWEALEWARATVERELNAANDNPLVDWRSGRVNSNSGNFHSQALAQGMDTLAASLTSVAVISDRRSARLVDEKLSDGLPAFLVRPPEGEDGCHNGFMLAQYTSAALVAESRLLAAPAAIHAVPVCANSEDHVSLAPLASRKTAEITLNLTTVVAIELLLACQGLDFRGTARAGRGGRAAHAVVRAAVPHWDGDRWLAPDIERVAALVRSGELVGAVEAEIGRLE